MSTSVTVCVTGMHRSGTSLTSRILNLLGVSLGPEEDLMPAHAEQNSSGFWEHAALTEISDRLLDTFDGSWRAPPELAGGWHAGASVAPLRRQARELLRDTFAGEPLWGWKDPRAALTLPFWQRFVPDARYVICIRNPIDVAASLARRNDLPARHCHELWFRYVRDAILNTAGRKREFICFEDYFEVPEIQIKRLAELVGSQRRLGKPVVQEALDAFIDDDLRHHRASLVDALDDPDVPLAVKSLYLTLVASTRSASNAVPAWLGSNLVEEPLDALARDLETVGQSSYTSKNHRPGVSAPEPSPRIGPPQPTVDAT